MTAGKYFKSSCVIFFLSGLATVANAQTVVKTNAAKGWVAAKLQDTSAATKGQHACFLDKEGTTVACGKIAKVTARLVIVRITPISATAQVQPGFQLEINESQPPASKRALKKSSKPSRKSAVRLLTSPGAGVVSVAKVGYVAPASNASGVALWEATDSRISMEKIAFGLEYELSNYSSTFGFRYAVYGDSSPQFVSQLVLQTDYDPTNRNRFVEATHSVSAIGSYYDYVVMAPRPRKSGLRVIGGIDYLNSTAKMTATVNDDSDSSSASLASITSTIGVFSLRAGADYQLRLGGSFELGVGLRALIPVAATGLTQKTTVTDDNMSKSIDVQKDLRGALDHKKSTVGFNLPIYASMLF